MSSCLPLALLLDYRQRKQQKAVDEEDTLSPLLSECVVRNSHHLHEIATLECSNL